MDEGLIREAVELLGLMAVGELRLLQTDRPEDLLRVALAARGNLWPTVEGRPGLLQGRTLAERRFVHIDDHRGFS